MYGQPYNNTTLEGCQPDPKAMTDKVSDFSCQFLYIYSSISN